MLLLFVAFLFMIILLVLGITKKSDTTNDVQELNELQERPDNVMV
jgi:preprotein translocase subunit SecG